MDKQNLKSTLLKLHGSLAQVDHIDNDLLDILQVLNKDIELILSQSTDDKNLSDAVADRLQEASAKFAAEYPNLEIILRELGKILSGMGI